MTEKECKSQKVLWTPGKQASLYIHALVVFLPLTSKQLLLQEWRKP
ncbi:hypothetical protein LEMLEM_LOCUS1369 [Lemmus lemmus]